MTQDNQTENAPGATPDSAPADDRPTNPYAKIYADFLEETADHVLTVRQDDGLQRRVYVGTPGNSMWSWGVTTWPGYLATFGDVADGFMFTRDIDMFQFFDRPAHLRGYYSDDAPCIDFRYWAQKLSGGRSPDVRVFSEEAFLERVREALEEDETFGLEVEAERALKIEVAKKVCARNGVDFEAYLADLRSPDKDPDFAALEIDASNDDEMEFFGLSISEDDPAELRAAILAQADENSHNEHEARTWLNECGHFEDAWEWDMSEFDLHFVITCYAIDLTVQLWRQYEAKQAETRKAEEKAAAEAQPHGDDYVLVEDGSVSNDPSLPIFDIDVLNGDFPGRTSAAEAVCLYGRIAEHPTASVDLADVLDRIVAFVSAYGTGADVLALHDHEALRQAQRDSAAHEPATTAGVSQD